MLKNEAYHDWTFGTEDPFCYHYKGAMEALKTSYWIEQGFSTEYAQIVCNLLKWMKAYTESLRRGDAKEIGEEIILDAGIGEQHACLLYNDNILLGHWKEFADALAQYQKFSHRHSFGPMLGIYLRNIQLPPQVIRKLSPVLKTGHIREICVENNLLDSEGISLLADIIESNPNLAQVQFDNNRIEDVVDMKRLCKAIASAADHLALLSFTKCFDGNNIEMLQAILESDYSSLKSFHLEEVHLDGNNIDSVGAALIASFLATNPCVDSLELNDNNLGDNGATQLSNGLKSNTNLSWLRIKNNNITARGRKALLKTIFDTTSLNACAASNHTLMVDLNPFNIHLNGAGITLRCNKREKLFTLLSATDEGFFNLNCLGDISYKVIPQVLSLVQGFSEAHPDYLPEYLDSYFELTGKVSAGWRGNTIATSSLFELLRGWAVPSLSD